MPGRVPRSLVSERPRADAQFRRKEARWRTNSVHFPICACHPCPCGAMLIFPVEAALGIEPRASRMLSGCDTTTPCAL